MHASEKDYSMASSSTAGAKRSVLERDPSQFCDNPPCLGVQWHEWIDNSDKCQLDVSAVENIFDHERLEQQFEFLDDLSLHLLVPHPDTKPQPIISHTRTLNHPPALPPQKQERRLLNPEWSLCQNGQDKTQNIVLVCGTHGPSTGELQLMKVSHECSSIAVLDD